MCIQHQFIQVATQVKPTALPLLAQATRGSSRWSSPMVGAAGYCYR